jgi:hypothetical protein
MFNVITIMFSVFVVLELTNVHTVSQGKATYSCCSFYFIISFTLKIIYTRGAGINIKV